MRFCDEIVMLIDGGKPMRRNKWKKAGLTVLSAVFMGSFSMAAADTGIPALAATKGRRGHKGMTEAWRLKV